LNRSSQIPIALSILRSFPFLTAGYGLAFFEIPFIGIVKSTTLGISMYMIVTGLELLKECRNALAIGKPVMNAGRPSIPSSLNPADAELISGCWRGAMNRLLFSQVVIHIHCAGGSSCSDIIAVDLLAPEEIKEEETGDSIGSGAAGRTRGSVGCRIRRARYSICVAGKRRSAARRTSLPDLDQQT
jgi:hypothetical protein